MHVSVKLPHSHKQTQRLHLQASPRERGRARLARARRAYLARALAVNRSTQGGDRVPSSCGERCDNAKNAAHYELWSVFLCSWFVSGLAARSVCALARRGQIHTCF